MKGRNSQQPPQPTHRVNDQIRITPVFVIGPDGDKLGAMGIAAAKAAALENGMDLVEIVPNQRPPVCRIMDYGKFRYDQTRAKKSQKKQAALKEVRLRPGTDVADRERAVAKAKAFLEKGHPVQLTMLFRGRENANKHAGMQTMSAIAAGLDDIGQVDRSPSPAGRRATMVISPRKRKPGDPKPVG